MQCVEFPCEIAIFNTMGFLDRKSISWLRLVCKEFLSLCKHPFFHAKLKSILSQVTGFNTSKYTEKELWSLCRFNLDRPRYKNTFYGDIFNKEEKRTRFVSKMVLDVIYLLTDNGNMIEEGTDICELISVVSMTYDYGYENYIAILREDGKVLVNREGDWNEVKGINNAVQIYSHEVEGDYIFYSDDVPESEYGDRDVCQLMILDEDGCLWWYDQLYNKLNKFEFNQKIVQINTYNFDTITVLTNVGTIYLLCDIYTNYAFHRVSNFGSIVSICKSSKGDISTLNIEGNCKSFKFNVKYDDTEDTQDDNMDVDRNISNKIISIQTNDVELFGKDIVQVASVCGNNILLSNKNENIILYDEFQLSNLENDLDNNIIPQIEDLYYVSECCGDSIGIYKDGTTSYEKMSIWE